jgi:hypothetical protein
MKEFENLLVESDEELFVQLGFVSEALSAEPSVLTSGLTGELERALTEDDPSARSHFLRSGKRILARTSDKLHRQICLGEDKEALEKLGHVDKWRSQRRIDVMSMKPRKLSAVLS